jgi:hypothetical protein
MPTEIDRKRAALATAMERAGKTLDPRDLQHILRLPEGVLDALLTHYHADNPGYVW